MKKIWETNGIFNDISTQARVVDMDGDLILEVIVPKEKETLFKRVKNALKYIFKNNTLGFGHFRLDRDDFYLLSKIGDVYYDR